MSDQYTSSNLTIYFSSSDLVMIYIQNLFWKLSNYSTSYSLVCFVEKDMLNTIPNEVIVERFHKMKERRTECKS
jgi:hypothetical protein